MNTKLELARVADVKPLKEAAVAAFSSDFEEYGAFPPGIESMEWHRAEIEKGHYYKIQYDGELAGGICVIPSGDEHIEIKYFFILDSYQNNGIGSETMGLIENQYKHIKEWLLVTPYKACRNHHYYEKLGYKKVREIQPDPDNEFTVYEYVKVC